MPLVSATRNSEDPSVGTGRVDIAQGAGSSALQGTTWLPDGRRILGWDGAGDKAFLWDTQTQSRVRVPGIPGPCEVVLAADGRTLLINQTKTESDIWMLTLK